MGNKRESGANLGRLGLAGESGESGANQGRLRLGGVKVGPTKGGWGANQVRLGLSVVLRAEFLSTKPHEG